MTSHAAGPKADTILLEAVTLLYDAAVVRHGQIVNARQRFAANQNPENMDLQLRAGTHAAIESLRRRTNPTDTAGGPNMPDAYRGFSLFIHNLPEAQYRPLLNRCAVGQAVAVHGHSVAFLSDCADYYELLVEDIINTCQSKGALPPDGA